VGCTDTSTCYAIEYENGASTPLTLQDLASGVTAIPLPAGASSVDPEAVACAPGTAWCTLAGYYNVPVSGSPGPATYPMIATTGASPIAFTSASVGRAIVGTPFIFEVKTTSTPEDALSATGLPAGFTFQHLGKNTATISGTATPSEVGTTNVTIVADNGVAPAASQAFKLKIAT
jgi:hypothetical protein